MGRWIHLSNRGSFGRSAVSMCSMNRFALGLLVAVAIPLAAQEEGMTFEPRYVDGPSPFNERTYGVALIIMASLFWKRKWLVPPVNKLILKYHRAARFCVPLLMLVWVSLILLIGQYTNGRISTVIAPLMILFVFVNIPTYLVVLVVSVIPLRTVIQPVLASTRMSSNLFLALSLSLIEFLVWYGIVRFWQWRLRLRTASESSPPSS